MGEFEEVELQKAPEQGTPEPRRRSKARWMLGGVLLAAVAFAAYFLFWNRVAPERPVSVAETEVAAGQRGLVGPAEEIDLPPLDETDALVRRLIGVLSSHPRIAAWLATDDLIRNFVVVVENIAAGSTPAGHLKVLAPGGEFTVVERGDDLRIDPRSYQRYDAIADAVASVDAAGIARVYATLKPRIEEAYRERGFVDSSFDRALERAIRRLLDTPIPPPDSRVEPRGIGYGFADPDLEELPAAQKQLLRMGPRNVRLIQDKLREIGEALGLNGL